MRKAQIEKEAPPPPPRASPQRSLTRKMMAKQDKHKHVNFQLRELRRRVSKATAEDEEVEARHVQIALPSVSDIAQRAE